MAFQKLPTIETFLDAQHIYITSLIYSVLIHIPVKMSTSAEIKEQEDFIKLDSQRYSVVSCLNTLKDSMKALPTDKPSLCYFNKLEN